jgi:hypothetical protein
VQPQLLLLLLLLLLGRQQVARPAVPPHLEGGLEARVHRHHQRFNVCRAHTAA